MIALFKVLVDGKSCHGGEAEYPPPGEWTEERTASCCNSGWHLTSDPLRWWKPKAELWLADGRFPLNGDGTEKAAFTSVRLIEHVTPEWPYLVVFPRIRCFLAASARSQDKDADIAWANLSWADLSGAYLSWANLSGANYLAPPMVLLASWGDVSDDLCADLMNYDASNHPDGAAAFASWAAGGPCPYTGCRVARSANFSERQSCYRPERPLQSALPLMDRLIAEKCQGAGSRGEVE